MENHRPDINVLRANARLHLDQGPVTESYRADREQVIELLNEALATELVCVLRYKRHYFMADGMNAAPVAAEFLQHAVEEQAHADMLATRIVQLQGQPDFNPATLEARSHAEYVTADNLVGMIREDLVAERIAITSYTQMIRLLGDEDVTTRRLLETILGVEEEHADDMLTFLKQLDTTTDPEHE